MQEEATNPVVAEATFQFDDLLEKLKILNYERQLLAELKMKPLSKYYFVKSVNPGEQFYMFTLICWWLCRMLGMDMERPQEYDDPNTVIANIMKILKDIVSKAVVFRTNLNSNLWIFCWQDMPSDFQPNKLMKGAGPICMQVLDVLATQALKVAKVGTNSN